MSKDFDLEAALAAAQRRRHCLRLARSLIRALNVSCDLDLGLELDVPNGSGNEEALACWVERQLQQHNDGSFHTLKRSLQRVLVDLDWVQA